MHRFSEHDVYHLRGCRPRLSCKISPGSVIIVAIQPEIPPLLRDNLALPFILLLVFLNPLILVNSIHELTYTSNRFPRQRLP